MEKRNYWVYTHTTPDGMVYTGMSQFETTNLRWVKSHYRPHTTFGREIEKWGWDNISHDVIATNLTHDEALRMEGEMIDFCKANGVSLNEKGSGGKWLGSPEYERYMSNRDEILRRQRSRHNLKRGTELLKEKGYIPLL